MHDTEFLTLISSVSIPIDSLIQILLGERSEFFGVSQRDVSSITPITLPKHFVYTEWPIVNDHL